MDDTTSPDSPETDATGGSQARGETHHDGTVAGVTGYEEPTNKSGSRPAVESSNASDERQTFSLPETCHARSGTVYLVGAGPGDPTLLTVRARTLIETADVILHDALIRQSMVDSLPESAKIYDVGKRVEYKTPQSEINDLLIEHATAGDAVVRLKGGDPFVFGRGGEEAQVLAAHDLPFQIVPGVSSVLAAPSVAGVPLTHREVSSHFTVITGHETPDKEESALDWTGLSSMVKAGGTLVILMGVRTLDRNVSALREHGAAGDIPVAVVQKATWEGQQVVTGTLDSIVQTVEDEDISAPATTIIGNVSAVRSELAECHQSL